ncbi:MAG: proton-conducting transporter membrane subunit [Bacteroidetes bacterium]|nr:proton-conducting transporter membrane subunit [Bacteroidota bacterium]
MEQFFIPAAVLCSFLILVLPGKVRFYFTLALTLFIICVTSIPAAIQLLAPFSATDLRPESAFAASLTSTNWIFKGYLGELHFTIDKLSSFFILITNFTVLTGILYSRGYLKAYENTKNPAQFALHYFSYTWLHFSMLAVLTLRDGLPFLIAWELMAVSSFMLILFEAEKRATLKTAVNYLVQMHIGFVLLLFAFLITESGTGQMSFDALPAYFANHSNIGLFLLFFAGFAVKAGFMPFHTWLPDAHPAAPSHVSGVMSGVMIKMGIYGIVRVLFSVQSDLFLIGWIILVVSAISGLMGVMLAITQHDLKKLLAYHSIENIGIIGMGLGLGTMGLALHNPILVLLGFSGGLLHVLNHSLFKSLLFFSSGSVYKIFHTGNLDQLGGVIHKMPRTSILFLFGAFAICGLPPLNGFISEVLIYLGLFNGLSTGSVYQSITLLLALIALTLIGGLAVFCFTKAFGVVFLGSPRKETQDGVAEVSSGMLFPQYLIAGMILLIGLLPMIFLNPLINLISVEFHLSPLPVLISLTGIFTKISLISLFLIILVSLLMIIRYLLLKSRKVEYGPTWGCGSLNTNSRQQYTGTSFADNFIEIAQPVLQSKEEYRSIREDEIFPSKRSFNMHPSDIVHSALNKATDFTMLVLKKLARLQTGNIRHYVLYAFIFILVIFVLLYLKLI